MTDLTRRQALAACSAVPALGLVRVALAEEDTMKEPLQAFMTKTLRAERAEGGGRYHRFLDEDTMSMGIYHLPRRAKDNQAPHDEDEVYYVLEGRAKLRVEDEVVDAVPGAVLYVAARAEHRFVEIEEDLTLLVFFSKARPKPARRP
jgi:mannose-6-phosphate isomerase-like protein (cupin superfamily)